MNFERMNVKKAVLSRTMAWRSNITGNYPKLAKIFEVIIEKQHIKWYISMIFQLIGFEGTEKFEILMNDVFDVLNGLRLKHIQQDS